MAHSSPSIPPGVPSQSIQTTSGGAYYNQHSAQGRTVPLLNTTSDSEDSREETLRWEDLPYDHPCWIYRMSQEEDSKKQLYVRIPPPPFDASHGLMPTGTVRTTGLE